MKGLIDFKNEVAREAGHVDWKMFVCWKQSYGDYPEREHDEAVTRYVDNMLEERKKESENLIKTALRTKRRT